MLITDVAIFFLGLWPSPLQLLTHTRPKIASLVPSVSSSVPVSGKSQEVWDSRVSFLPETMLALTACLIAIWTKTFADSGYALPFICNTFSSLPYLGAVMSFPFYLFFIHLHSRLWLLINHKECHSLLWLLPADIEKSLLRSPKTGILAKFWKSRLFDWLSRAIWG